MNTQPSALQLPKRKTAECRIRSVSKVFRSPKRANVSCNSHDQHFAIRCDLQRSKEPRARVGGLHLFIQCRSVRASRDQCSFNSSPELIAVFHALLRLLAPRHPPHALSSLAALIPSSDRVATSRARRSFQLPVPNPPSRAWAV
jgi:hypothetical protein